MSSKIRLGLLVNGPTVSAWQFFILQQLLADGNFDVVLAVENGEVPGGTRRLRHLAWHLPWLVANKADALSRRLFRSGPPNDVDAKVPLSALGVDFPRLRVTPITGRHEVAHRFAHADLDKICTYYIDVMLRFGFNILEGDILKLPPFGIWSYHHADNRINRGGPPGFWEFLYRQPVTGAVLQVLTEDLDNGIVLRRGYYKTFCYSWNENRRRVYWNSVWLMIDALKELANRRVLPLRDDAPPPFGVYSGPLYVHPGPLTVVLALIVSWFRMARHFLNLWFSGSFLREQWRVLLYEGELKDASIHRFRQQFAPGRERFWADPFVLERDGRTWIFMEDFHYKNRKGRIACIEVDRGGMVSHTVVLDQPYHLSYPFLFTFGERLYMIPESYSNHTVELWECTDFPSVWKKRHNIMEGVSAADTTLVEHEGTWWMFTNLDRSGIGAHCVELHIFHATDPVNGEWIPHPHNPVVVDVRRARMAGGFFRTADGRLFRCAQDNCGEIYGENVVICEVVELSKRGYRENVAEVIKPDWGGGVFATHHLSLGDGIVVLDACTRVLRI